MTTRTALVTGSVGGVGAAIATGLADAGVRVVGHGLPGEVRSGQTPPAVTAWVEGDLAVPGTATEIVHGARERVGSIDILVLNASVQIPAAWEDTTPADVDRQFRINVGASLELIQQVVPGMRASGWGRVLAIGSVQHYRPHPRMIAYAASKSALLTMVRTLAPLLAPDGITINTVSPGVIDTPRNSDALADDAYRATLLGRIPVGRIGAPADCVGAAVLLCSPHAAYITGQDIVVDGGLTIA